jgi:hypothetical protein
MNVSAMRTFLRLDFSGVRSNPDTDEDRPIVLTRASRHFADRDTRLKARYNIHGYSFVDILGSGRSGEVVQLTKDGEDFAVKICKVQRAKFSFLNSPTHDPRQEAQILRNINHPHIVKIYDFIDDVDNGRLYIVMELLPAGTIDQLPDLESKRRAFGELVTAVEHLHLLHLAHRDIKPANVLLDDSGHVRLCDFGVAVHAPPGAAIPTSFEGTPAIFAPEIFEQSEYDPLKADIWSLGVTLYMLAFEHCPFDGVNMMELHRVVVACRPEFPEDANPALKDLLCGLLQADPDARLTFPDIWAHPWMNGVKPSMIALLVRVRDICSVTCRVTQERAIVKVERGKVDFDTPIKGDVTGSLPSLSAAPFLDCARGLRDQFRASAQASPLVPEQAAAGVRESSPLLPMLAEPNGRVMPRRRARSAMPPPVSKWSPPVRPPRSVIR